MFRRAFALLTTAVLVFAPAATGSVAGGTPGPKAHAPNIVRLVGNEVFEANALIQATFRFSPERQFPHSGERVRWIDRDQTADPHTVTLIRKSQLPTSLPEVFNCEPCNEALDAHFGAGPPVHRVNVGEPGLDRPGDSLLLFDGESIGAKVSAPSGKRLFYVCAIHPWMQGQLKVG